MTGFERYAPAMAVFFGLALSVPLGFGTVVLTGGSPVTPDIYGPLVHQIPALVWVVFQLSVTVLAVFGCVTLRPRAAAAGAVAVGALLSFFAGAAVLAGAPGTLLVFGAGGWVAPASFVAAAVAWRGRDGRG